MKPILALLLAACTEHPTYIHIETSTPSLEMALGANAWYRVGLEGGFEVRDEATLSVSIELVPGLRNGDGNKVNGTTNRDTLEIQIDARLTGRALQHVVAHELAHAAFECDHLTHGEGIMSFSPPAKVWIIEPTEADYDLACDHGYCR